MDDEDEDLGASVPDPATQAAPEAASASSPFGEYPSREELTAMYYIAITAVMKADALLQEYIQGNPGNGRDGRERQKLRGAADLIRDAHIRAWYMAPKSVHRLVNEILAVGETASPDAKALNNDR